MSFNISKLFSAIASLSELSLQLEKSNAAKDSKITDLSQTVTSQAGHITDLQSQLDTANAATKAATDKLAEVVAQDPVALEAGIADAEGKLASVTKVIASVIGGSFLPSTSAPVPAEPTPTPAPGTPTA